MSDFQKYEATEAVILDAGFFHTDVDETGAEMFDLGTDGDDWFSIAQDGSWKHHRDPERMGRGTVLASGSDAESLFAYLMS